MARVQGVNGQWNTANLSGIADGAAIRERIFRSFGIDNSGMVDFVLLRKEITSEGSGIFRIIDNLLVLSEPSDAELSRIVSKSNYSDIQLQFLIKRKADYNDGSFSPRNLAGAEGNFTAYNY